MGIIRWRSMLGFHKNQSLALARGYRVLLRRWDLSQDMRNETEVFITVPGRRA